MCINTVFTQTKQQILSDVSGSYKRINNNNSKKTTATAHLQPYGFLYQECISTNSPSSETVQCVVDTFLFSRSTKPKP